MGSERIANPQQKKTKPKLRPANDAGPHSKSSGAPAGLPRFLKAGKPGDTYERQADRIADAAAKSDPHAPTPEVSPGARVRSAAPALPVADSGTPLGAAVRARVEPVLSGPTQPCARTREPRRSRRSPKPASRSFLRAELTGVGLSSSTDTKIRRYPDTHVNQCHCQALLQREIAPGTGTDNQPKETDSCAGCRGSAKPSGVAGRYVRDRIPGFDHGGVQTIQCDANATKPPYTCHVQFGCGMVIDISVYKGYIWAQVNDAGNPKPDAPICRYDFQCPPQGGLILTPGTCFLNPFP